MRVFALTFGGPDAPSTLFRIHQYADAFRAAGVELDHAVAKDFDDFQRLERYDVVLLELTLVSASALRRIRRHARVLVYDTCDRIWMRPGREYDWLTRTRLRHRLRTIARGADLCLAANGVIADDLRAARARRIELLPMSIDTAQWNAVGRRAPDGTVTVGWSGSPGNLAFLRPVVPALRAVAQRHPHVRIAVHCGRRPELDGLPFEHLPYAPGREPEAVRTFDVGLLPLPDDPFVRGKSPIKALQYFACGAAVIGQDVGATAELLRHDVNALTVGSERDWQPNLERLVQDGELRTRLAAAGTRTVVDTHATAAVFERFLDLLRTASATERALR